MTDWSREYTSCASLLQNQSKAVGVEVELGEPWEGLGEVGARFCANTRAGLLEDRLTEESEIASVSDFEIGAAAGRISRSPTGHPRETDGAAVWHAPSPC